DIKADMYSRNTVYVALDNHKYGDFKPYLLKSTDAGRTWTNMTANLPENLLVWRIVQDHVDKDLFFLATEFGIYFTVNGGAYWSKLKGGVPTISFRDLAIQKRENDLVGASFGRSFYVLDDYSFLREVSEEQMQADATLFAPRKAWWYIPRPKLSFYGNGSQGADHYVADNPPFGAVFTYHLGEGPKTMAAERKKAEKDLNKDNKDVPFPGWDALATEMQQDGPKVMIAISDASGQVIRRIKGKASQGFHRINWDLRYPGYNTVRVGERSGWAGRGLMAPPGTYTATLYRMMDGEVEQLGQPQKLQVERLYDGALKGANTDQVVSFWRELENTQAAVSAASFSLRKAKNRTKAMKTALSRANAAPGGLDTRLHAVHQQLVDIDMAMNGNPAKAELGEKDFPTIGERLGYAFTATERSSYGPTVTARRNVDIAKEEFKKLRDELTVLIEVTMPALEREIREAGAPWIEGQPLPKVD
ncbi:MAG: glycosyl hydrolase, partial [Bacteroidota bacterium]